MARMRAVDAAAAVLQKEGITTLFGVPGAAINPLYSALRKNGGFRHVLARHVEGASHMAEGYTRARPGHIGVCLGTSGPAGTDMITGLYSASGDSIPILCITGQAPRAQLHKESFQAVDIETIAKPVTKWAVMAREPELVPRILQQAFHVMRSGRPGPVLVDLPFDVQMRGNRIRRRHLRTAAGLQARRHSGPGRPRRGHAQRGRAPPAGRRRRHLQRPGRRPAAGIRQTDRRARHPHPDGLGRDPLTTFTHWQ
ncbi:hypothetical protein CDEN61S_04120 [Castellaniella denitrificans]